MGHLLNRIKIIINNLFQLYYSHHSYLTRQPSHKPQSTTQIICHPILIRGPQYRILVKHATPHLCDFRLIRNQNKHSYAHSICEFDRSQPSCEFANYINQLMERKFISVKLIRKSINPNTQFSFNNTLHLNYVYILSSVYR